MLVPNKVAKVASNVISWIQEHRRASSVVVHPTLGHDGSVSLFYEEGPDGKPTSMDDVGAHCYIE